MAWRRPSSGLQTSPGTFLRWKGLGSSVGISFIFYFVTYFFPPLFCHQPPGLQWGGSLLEGTSFMRAPEALPPNTTTLGARLQHMNLGVHKH